MSLDKVRSKIAELETKRTDWFVHKDTIQYMRRLLHLFNGKRVLEIGTHIGFSALCFSLDAKEVITIEKDTEFLKEARENLHVAENITLLEGNALDVLKQLQEKKEMFDFVFIDAQKPEYAQYVELCLPLLTEKGGIFADNTISHKEKLLDFFEYLKKQNISHKELGIGDGLVMIAGETYA